MKKTFLLIALILSLAVLFGCASSMGGVKESTMNSAAGAPREAAATSAPSENYYSYGADEKGEADIDDVSYPVRDLVVDPSRKMIWIGEVSFETTDFNSTVDALYALIGECGGFVQSSAVTGEGRTSRGELRLRNARYTVRIPSENFQLFMKSSGNVATVLNSSTNAQDVTAEYVDTEARLRVLEVKEERLLEMLEQTKNVEYTDELQFILQLENELGNVRYEIERLTGSLRKFDDLISYSTVTVYLQEVREYTATPPEPETIGERISTRFSATLKRVIDTCEDIIVWLVGSSPVLIILGMIATAVILVTRRVRKRKKLNSAALKTDVIDNK